MKDLIPSLKEVISERISSPLSASFIVSWLVINYKFLLVIFSFVALDEKFRYITELYPSDTWTGLGMTILKLLVLPLLAAGFYIYIYPIPARAVFRHAKTEQVKLQATRTEIENARVLTVEEADQLKKHFYLGLEELRRMVSGRDDEIGRLREERDLAVNEKNQLEKKILKQKNDDEHVTLEKVLTSNTDKENIKALNSILLKVDENQMALNENKAEHEFKEAYGINLKQANILKYIHSQIQGRYFTDVLDLSRNITSELNDDNIEVIDVEYAIDNFREKELLFFKRNNSEYLTPVVTDLGKEAIVRVKNIV